MVLDGVYYKVLIVFKDNKHTYLRVTKDLVIKVTTNLNMKNNIDKLLTDNVLFIKKRIKEIKKLNEYYDLFYYLGKNYDIVYNNTQEVLIKNSKIYINSKKDLTNWLNNKTKEILEERLKYNYNGFEENIPYPKLIIKKLKSSWGICNYNKKTITLNKNLIRNKLECIDYIIVHELCHLVYPNHSKSFWNLVNKYIPNYKKIKKQLR